MKYLIHTSLILLFCLSFLITAEAQTTVEVEAGACVCNPTVECLCEPGPWIALPCPAPCESFGTQTFYRVYPSTYEFVHPDFGLLSGTCPPPPPGGAVMFEPCFNPTPCGPQRLQGPAESAERLACVESGPITCTPLNVLVYDGYPYEVSPSQVYPGSCPVTLGQTIFSCADEGLNNVFVFDEDAMLVCIAEINVICRNGTPCSNSCQASINPILPPTSINSTAVSNDDCTEDGWTYYEHPNVPGKYLFGINWAPDGSITGTNSMAKANANVSINVLNSYNEASNASSGSFIMGRYWNVNNAGTFDEPVSIRFFYDDAELTNTKNAATVYANSVGEDNISFSWFKQNTNFNPVTDNNASFSPDVLLYPNGTGNVDGIDYVEFDGITSFSGGGFIAGTSSVLPVELIHFDGRAYENHVMLNWGTASELNNEKFEIEESTNGTNFRKVGEVKGYGTTSERQDYSFNIERPQNGITYYRLKQIDFDGQYEYSHVISVNYKGKGENVGDFYPNPSKSGNVQLSYISENDDEISIAVFDITGKQVFNQSQNITSGVNNLSFEFSDLTVGTYIVRIGDGKNQVHRKLVIN